MTERQESIEKAAALIQNASMILVMAGAGFSAEAGLKTYEEINEKILGTNKEYADYCDPDLLKDDAYEFWRFWGSSANDYHRAQPHIGYEILKKWRDHSISSQTSLLKNHFQAYFQDHYDDYKPEMPVPSNFFVKCGIPPSELLEIHGNASLLQCSKGVECCQSEASEVWPASLPIILKNKTDMPRCHSCGSISRPYVLMFNDEEWLGLEEKGPSVFDLYDVWEEGVEDYLQQHSEESIVIIELGCGDRVPVVKMESETVLGDITNIVTENGAKEVKELYKRVSLVRINLNPAAYLDYHEKWSNGNSHIDPSTIVCIEGTCGDVLRDIGDHIHYPVC